MSAPKLTRILDVFATRLAAIDGTGSYDTCIGTDVRRSKRIPTGDDLPCVLIYLDPRSPDKANNAGKAVCAGSVVVEGYVERNAEEETLGIQVISDIQRAVETDRDLGDLLLNSQGGLQWQGDEIIYPDSGDSVVGGRVEYSIPHLREPGDPQVA